MGGRQFQKVRPGEPLRIPADAYNAFVDAARGHQGRQADLAATPGRTVRRTDILPVRNSSGGNVDRFAILGIDSVLITPTDNLDEFKNRPALDGITPDIDVHAGRFVVTIEPIASGKIGRAVAAGVTPVQVNVTIATHDFAEVDDG